MRASRKTALNTALVLKPLKLCPRDLADALISRNTQQVNTLSADSGQTGNSITGLTAVSPYNPN